MALRDSGKEHTGGQRRSTQKRTALNNRSLPCGIEFTSLICIIHHCADLSTFAGAQVTRSGSSSTSHEYCKLLRMSPGTLPLLPSLHE